MHYQAKGRLQSLDGQTLVEDLSVSVVDEETPDSDRAISGTFSGQSLKGKGVHPRGEFRLVLDNGESFTIKHFGYENLTASDNPTVKFHAVPTS